jgi:hypothetical protein
MTRVPQPAALVLNAPHSRFRGTGETFDEMFKSGLAAGYILSENEVAQLSTGCKVILLDKEKERRAEGQLKTVKKAEKASNGKQRYDVHFEKAKLVPYISESLKRNGVAVI